MAARNSNLGALVLPESEEGGISEDLKYRVARAGGKISANSAGVIEIDKMIKATKVELMKLPLYQKLMQLEAKKRLLRKQKADAEVEHHAVMQDVCKTKGTTLADMLSEFINEDVPKKLPKPKGRKRS